MTNGNNGQKSRPQKTRTRANGEGSIYKIGSKKYKAVLIVGWDANGKKITKSCTAPSKAEADKRLAELKVKYGRNLITEPQKVTVKEWGTTWLETYKAKRLSKSTLDLYTSMWNTHIQPAFGQRQLNKVNPEECQRFFNALTHSKEKGGKGLSVRSAEICKHIVSQIFKTAMQRGISEKNPCELVVLPPNRAKSKKVISKEDLKIIFNAAGEYNDGSIFIEIAIFVFTGMRISEVLALNWDQINFKEGSIFIDAKVVDHAGHLERVTADEGDATKNGKSRSIPIGSPLKILLLNHYIKTIRDDKVENLKDMLDKPVVKSRFHGEKYNGQYKSPNNWRRSFRKLLEPLGISATPHQFRHTVATTLIEQGEELITVSELLGHSSTAVTEKVYIHEIAKRKRKAIDSLNHIIE